MFWNLLQVVSQDIFSSIAAWERLVKSLQVQVFSLQVSKLSLYCLPLLDDDLEQSLKIGTFRLEMLNKMLNGVLTIINIQVQVNIIISTRTQKVRRE